MRICWQHVPTSETLREHDYSESESTVSVPLVSKGLAKVMENFGDFDRIFFGGYFRGFL